MEEVATLYDMSDTLVGDFLIPIRKEPIPIITVEDRYFVYDKFDEVYREGMRYHISQLLN
jgi:hypothetical protein